MMARGRLSGPVWTKRPGRGFGAGQRKRRFQLVTVFLLYQWMVVGALGYHLGHHAKKMLKALKSLTAFKPRAKVRHHADI